MIVDSRPRVAYVGPDSGWSAIVSSCRDQADLLRAEPSSESVARALETADALVDAAIRVPITDAMIAAAQRLRVISCASTGTDHVARSEVDRRGISVRSLRDYPAVLRDLTPAAELTWALLMACARKLPEALLHVREGGWDREQFPGVMLNGRQLGLIGCGRIGRWMARYARAFGMHVVGYDPNVPSFPTEIERRSIESVVQTSDVLSVHVPLLDETRGLVSADLFGQIKPGAIFLNTSRGAVIDEAALLAGLNSGRISAAGIDVLHGEPAVADHPLLAYARRHTNLLITPHCGGYSPDAVAIVAKHALAVALALLRGEAA